MTHDYQLRRDALLIEVRKHPGATEWKIFAPDQLHFIFVSCTTWKRSLLITVPFATVETHVAEIMIATTKTRRADLAIFAPRRAKSAREVITVIDELLHDIACPLFI
jgi:hypothetical protein